MNQNAPKIHKRVLKNWSQHTMQDLCVRSQEEVATIMGTSRQNVQATERRALDKCAAYFKKLGLNYRNTL